MTFSISKNYLAFSFLAGCLNVFSFSPFNLWFLQIISLSMVFFLYLKNKEKKKFWIGWFYAFGSLIFGINWIYTSLNTYGGLNPLISVLAIIILSGLLATLYGASFSFSNFLEKNKRNLFELSLIILPMTLILADWIRGWIFTGFPWLAFGYAHTNSPLSGYAPIFGVFGIGIIAAMISGAIALMFFLKKPNINLLFLIFLFIIFGSYFSFLNWTSPFGKKIKVALIQGNVPQNLKFEPYNVKKTLTLYKNLITSTNANLIAAPETALPIISSKIPKKYFQSLQAHVENTNSNIIIGIPWNEENKNYFNSAIGISKKNQNYYRYDKNHLVPFGEFIPYGTKWFVKMMNIPLGDFSRGKFVQQPFRVNEQYVLPNICYEDLFGEEIALKLFKLNIDKQISVNILLNLSNIAWFGDSIALHQHLQISQMRALETGRPVLRATNTGSTAIIDHKGKVVSKLPSLKKDILIGEIQGMSGITPYILHQNIIPIGLAFILLFMIWLKNSPSKN